MYPHLIENSYIKIKPDGDIASFVFNKVRTNVDINETACEILKYCNGYYDIDEIIKKVSINHGISIETARMNVEEFLMPLAEMGAIIDKKENMNKTIVKGSKEIYYPDNIIWELTTQCPLRCKHCYLPNKEPIFIKRDEIDKILDIIDRTGVYSVQLTGGEALLHSDLLYIVEHLIESNIHIALSTSGMILNTMAKNVFVKVMLIEKCSLMEVVFKNIKS
ncbi:MAG: PqqD family peptide modification chaperone [Lachnotalea sp.]